MKTVNRKIASQILALGLTVSTTPLLKAQTAVNDLDRDGISNISDTDVDNDGILNGSDLNIDGGVAKSGPLKGQYIGDRIANDNAAELDMDADGLSDNAANESDIDGDRLADNSKLEIDIDADGRSDTATNESDIDGDGLADNSVNEIDIDGDSVLDNAQAEQDIDGDGSANGLDGDVDGDGLANNSDSDMDGSGIDDATLDILYESPFNSPIYAADALVAPTIAFVSAEVRKALKIPLNDMGLRVRVQAGDGKGDQPGRWGNYVRGVWRYLSSDRIQVWARWCYPVSDPSQLKIFVKYSYIGPWSGNPVDYTDPPYAADFINPANYVVSDENQIYSGFNAKGELSLMRIASSPNLFFTWLTGNSNGVSVFNMVPEDYYGSQYGFFGSGLGMPDFTVSRYDFSWDLVLRNPLSAVPNFIPSRGYSDFTWGTSSNIFPGVQPILKFLRIIRQVNSR